MKNEQMLSLTQSIARIAPGMFLACVVLSYLVNALLTWAFITKSIITAAIPYPSGLGAIVAFSFQYFRATILLSGLMGKGRYQQLPFWSAFFATVLCVAELYSSISASGLASYHFAAVFLVSLAIILGGYVAEIVFIGSANNYFQGANQTPQNQGGATPYPTKPPYANKEIQNDPFGPPGSPATEEEIEFIFGRKAESGNGKAV